MDIPKDIIYQANGATPPDLLEQLVNELPDIPEIDLEDYGAVISKLHDEKAHSFRQIVEFLRQHGIETNRSAVYRVYKEASLPTPPEEEDPLVDPDTGEVVEP